MFPPQSHPSDGSEGQSQALAPGQPRDTGPFTRQQLYQLKAQILAYRFIESNQQLPAHLLQAIRGQAISPASMGPPSQLEQKPNGSLPPPPTTEPPKQVAPSIPKQTFPTPPSLQVPAPAAPAKIDVNTLIAEREKRIKARISNRIQEIEALPATLPAELKLRAQIEGKALQLLAVQRSVRKAVADEIRRLASFEAASDRLNYKRPRKLRDARNEREQASLKLDHEQQRQKKHRDFLAAVVNHQKEFREFHNNTASKLKKVTRSVLNYHIIKERKEQQRRERDEKERLRALKANNEEEYLKLLEKTKNDRLMSLLKQTDEHLSKLGAIIEEERARVEDEDRQGKDAEGEEGKEDGEKDVPSLQEEKKTYYTIAHSIKEEIKTQPEILVGGQLKEYQLQGLQWLVSLYNNNLNGILADEMGLGKTIQTIALLTYIMEKKGLNGPFLVIVPLSTLANWTMEFEKWAPSIKKVVFKGQRNTRKQIYNTQIASQNFNVVLTTYEFVMKDKNLLSKIKWNYIIIDEGHRMKNRHCKLAVILAQHYHSRHRLLLTGTPLQNSLPELWALLNFLLPNIFNSVENFEQWFNAPFAAAGEKVEMNEEETLLIIARLHKVLRPFLLRRLKTDVESQLPEKVEKVLKCEMSAMQLKLYTSMMEKGVMHYAPTGDGKDKSQKGLMNTLMQLRKICNHPYLFQHDFKLDDDFIRSSGKFELLDRLLPKLFSSGHRVLMFSQMTRVMDLMEIYFGYRDIPYLRLDGTTKADERGELLQRFNAPGSPYKIFILSTRAGGLGLNLQTADTVILFDSDWNPQIDLQAQDRAHRIGQTKEVRVFRLVTSNSIEELILNRARFKLNIDAKIIQAGMFNNQSQAEERKEYLESLLRGNWDPMQEVDVATNKQLNRMVARSEEEFRLFEKFDKDNDATMEAKYKALGRPRPPRLMTDDELPEWLSNAIELEDEEEEVSYGRGNRVRKEVNYDDGLSEKKFLQILESSSNPEEDLLAAAGKRKHRREAREAALASKEALPDSDEEEEEERPRAKRRAVASATAATPEKAVATPPRKPGRPREIKAAPQQQLLSKRLMLVLDRVRKEKDDTGRVISKLFHRLPSKKDYPDYYELIKQPIDMKKVQSKIEKFQYRSREEFEADMRLMFNNAQEYNIPGSQVFLDAVQLQELTDAQCAAVFAQPDSDFLPPPVVPASPLISSHADKGKDKEKRKHKHKDKDKEKHKHKHKDKDKRKHKHKHKSKRSGLDDGDDSVMEVVVEEKEKPKRGRKKKVQPPPPPVVASPSPSALGDDIDDDDDAFFYDDD